VIHSVIMERKSSGWLSCHLVCMDIHKSMYIHTCKLAFWNLLSIANN